MSKKFSGSDGRVLWLTLSLAGLLWLGGFLGLSTSLMAQVNRGYLPIQKVIISGVIQLKLQVLHLREAWQAEQALVSLRYRYADLLTEVVKLRAVEAENLALKIVENTDRKLLNYRHYSNYLLCPASFEFSSEAGITSGMMVMAQNQLLGFVTEVKVGQL
jgi:hypothetical protein